MLPEAAAAADQVLPQPRLALVHARRRARVEGCALEGDVDALLVERVTRLVQRGEQRLADVVLAHARGDTHVPGGELGAERVMRLVEPPALEVVAHALDDSEPDRQL